MTEAAEALRRSILALEAAMKAQRAALAVLESTDAGAPHARPAGDGTICTKESMRIAQVSESSIYRAIEKHPLIATKSAFGRWRIKEREFVHLLMTSGAGEFDGARGEFGGGEES